MGAIVVGVDGSPSSIEALRFAFREARMRGSSLVALHAWVLPLYEAPGPPPIELTVLAGPPLSEVRAALQTAADATLDAALREVEGETAGVEVERRVIEGPPAQMLVDAAEGADLLVVGSRGRGGLRGLLLGSVSHQCAQHATCPVVIVRAP